MTAKRVTAHMAPDVAQAMQQEAIKRDISISKAMEVAAIHWLMTVGVYPSRSYTKTEKTTKGAR